MRMACLREGSHPEADGPDLAPARRRARRLRPEPVPHVLLHEHVRVQLRGGISRRTPARLGAPTFPGPSVTVGTAAGGKAPLERTARKLGRRCPYGGAEVSMAGSYSTDLRERVLAAMEAGETPEVAARRFTGGRSTA